MKKGFYEKLASDLFDNMINTLGYEDTLFWFCLGDYSEEELLHLGFELDEILKTFETLKEKVVK